MKYLLALALLFLGCTRPTPKSDVSNFEPRLFDAMADMVYKITSYPNQSVGTAFAVHVGPAIFLITNAHVCGGEIGVANVLVADNQKSNNRFRATVIAADFANDLCFLKPWVAYPDGSFKEFAQIPAIAVTIGADSDLDNRKIGATYLAVGHAQGGPLMFEALLDKGDTELVLPHDDAYCATLMAQDEVPEDKAEGCLTQYKVIVMQNYCLPGQSGSPIINDQGQLIGVAQATYIKKNECYAVAASHIIDDLKGILAP